MTGVPTQASPSSKLWYPRFPTAQLSQEPSERNPQVFSVWMLFLRREKGLLGDGTL